MSEPSSKFFCFTCGHDVASRVLDTRGHRRRRLCLECGGTFSTVEQLAPRGKQPRHRARSRAADLPFELTGKAS